MAKILIALAVLQLGGICAADPLDQALTTAMQRHGWAGASALAESRNGPARVAVAGLSSIEANVPVDAATGFHMCSINKTLTAVAILRLVDQGRLSLDTKVTDILTQPVIRGIPYIGDVSVRQLLDHSSGIYPTNNDPAYIGTLVGRDALTKRVWSPLELVELATRPENKPVAKPGEGHHYSDTNYILLGLIVEQLSHESIKSHLQRTILEPLQMRNTYFFSDVLAGKRAAPANLASGYITLTKDLTDAITFNSGFKSPRPGLLNMDGAAERIDAAAGLITTLGDLHRFASALFRGKLLSAKSQAFLTSVQGEMAGAEVGTHKTRALQGAITPFGFVLYKEGDGPGGFNTLMAYHPQTDTVFVGYTNEFGHFDEVETLMTDVMSAAISQ